MGVPNTGPKSLDQHISDQHACELIHQRLPDKELLLDVFIERSEPLTYQLSAFFPWERLTPIKRALDEQAQGISLPARSRHGLVMTQAIAYSKIVLLWRAKKLPRHVARPVLQSVFVSRKGIASLLQTPQTEPSFTDALLG